jgi:hypothetical protein
MNRFCSELKADRVDLSNLVGNSEIDLGMLFYDSTLDEVDLSNFKFEQISSRLLFCNSSIKRLNLSSTDTNAEILNLNNTINIVGILFL